MSIDPTAFMSKDNFACIIENFVRDDGINHFEAVIAFCEETNRELEDVVKFMSPVLLDKVRQSARDMGLMPQEATIEGL